MKYISVKQAAQKWGTTERTVQGYCKNQKIPDAKQMGKQWLIPAIADRPTDGRTRQMKKNFDFAPYHFPVFLYTEHFNDYNGLTEDEVTLAQAQMLVLKGEYIQSFEMCKKLIDTTDNACVKFGAYATNADIAIILGFSTELNISLAAMEKIRDENPCHKEDYKLIIAYFRLLCHYFSDDIKSIDIRQLSSEALDVYELMQLNIAIFDKTYETAYAVKNFELLCRRLERQGITPGVALAHGCLAQVYTHFGDNENRLFHTREACRICCEEGYYTVFSKISTTNYREYLDIVRMFSKEFAEKADKIHRRNIGNVAKNILLRNPQTPLKKMMPLDADDVELVLLLSNGLSIKTIAVVKSISPKKVSAMIADICKRMGFQTKAELVQYANTCFPRGQTEALLSGKQ